MSGGPWRSKVMPPVIPTEHQARAHLARQLAHGCPVKAALVRSVPLFDIALNGTEAETLNVKTHRRRK